MSRYSAEEAQRRELRLPRVGASSAERMAERQSLEIQAYDAVCFPGLAAEWGSRRPFVGPMPLDKVRGLSKQKSRGQEWNDLQEWNAGMGQGLGGGSRIGTDRAVRRLDSSCTRRRKQLRVDSIVSIRMASNMKLRPVRSRPRVADEKSCHLTDMGIAIQNACFRVLITLR